MPKPILQKDLAAIESEMIKAGLDEFHQWRPDLQYPESHSDMQGFCRGVLRRFEVTRRPAPLDELPTDPR